MHLRTDCRDGLWFLLTYFDASGKEVACKAYEWMREVPEGFVPVMEDYVAHVRDLRDSSNLPGLEGFPQPWNGYIMIWYSGSHPQFLIPPK